MTAPVPCSRQPKQLDAGMFQAEISSFALRLAAGGKAAKTIRSYTEAVHWFAAAHLTDHHSRAAWEQVRSRDIQWWMAWLLDRYSTAACGYLQAERRLGHVVTILEHVHSRQFCVTDAHLSERAYAIQIGGSRATAATSDHHAARLEIINCGVRDLARSSPRPLGPTLFEQVKDRAPWGLHVCLVKTGDRMSWSRPVSVHERGTRV